MGHALASIVSCYRNLVIYDYQDEEGSKKDNSKKKIIPKPNSINFDLNIKYEELQGRLTS